MREKLFRYGERVGLTAREVSEAMRATDGRRAGDQALIETHDSASAIQAATEPPRLALDEQAGRFLCGQSSEAGEASIPPATDVGDTASMADMMLQLRG